MATTRFIDHLLEGDHASRPAAGDVPEGTLYSCTTHSLVYQSDTSTWSTWATLGGGSSDLDAIIAASSGQNIADALAGAASPATGNVFATIADLGGGAVDPIFDMFGTPDTTFEFDTSSFTGLTSIGGVTAEDADTTVPDYYWLKVKTNSNPYWGGRYAAVSQPFTAITRFFALATAGTHQLGLMLAETSPASFDALTYGVAGSGTNFTFHLQRWTLGSFGGAIADTGPIGFGYQETFLAIVAHSNTNVDYLGSGNGYLWYPITTGRNPSLTLGSIGLIASAQNTGTAVAGAFDYLRIWNSAKTFVTQ